MEKIKEVEIELNEDIVLRVIGDYRERTEDVWYLPNGDPGYPGDAASFEIKEIEIIQGDLTSLIFELPKDCDIVEFIEDKCIEKLEQW